MAFVAVAPTSLRSTAFLATPVSARPACRHRPALPVAAAPSRVVVGMAADGIKRVLVSGATGRTGKLAMAKLAKHADQLQAVGLVRSAEKAATVFGDGVETVVGDVTDRDQVFSIVRNNRIDALIVLSSAIPKFKPAEPGQRREHYFDDGQEPESVDWEGGRNMVDAAKDAGVSHVVFVGSMGSTDTHHPLNVFGNMLKWKRKAEQYLLDSGVPYTVVNPGGLQDADGGRRELIVGNSDDIYKLFGTPAIPRADVATLAVQALLNPETAKTRRWT
eukprot:TRINITY_DN1590_c0_g1_i2.p1 TRINITY_DN1590_c0_g1~~TRINITY_DN1590_c0_g1_i2.p1  ORF type:complete len:275 (-),score=117.07 TRINITY_DN1590_c0_g1_i2:326-1150(-)